MNLPLPAFQHPNGYERTESGLEMYYFDQLSKRMKDIWTAYPIQISLIELVHGPNLNQINRMSEDELAQRVMRVYTDNTIDSALIPQEAALYCRKVADGYPNHCRS